MFCYFHFRSHLKAYDPNRFCLLLKVFLPLKSIAKNNKALFGVRLETKNAPGHHTLDDVRAETKQYNYRFINRKIEMWGIQVCSWLTTSAVHVRQDYKLSSRGISSATIKQNQRPVSNS